MTTFNYELKMKKKRVFQEDCLKWFETCFKYGIRGAPERKLKINSDFQTINIYLSFLFFSALFTFFYPVNFF